MICCSSVKHKSRNSEKCAGHTSVNIVNENYDKKMIVDKILSHD